MRLEPLAAHHRDGLAAAVGPDPAAFPLAGPGQRRLDARRLARAGRARGRRRAPACRSRCSATASLAGSSSYLDIAPGDGRIEIGHTWYGAPWRGTRLNPTAKLLLLEHAFDVLGATRVQLKTDARNEQSRRAIAGVGATFEGILRKHSRRADGPGLRDVAMFSVTDDDWPRVQALLGAADRLTRAPRKVPMETVRAEEFTALTRVARAASDALAPAARAEQVLAELQGLVPFVCAQLTCWDPVEERHSTLASHGYAEPLLEHLSGPMFESELAQLDMLRTRRPMRMRDLPGDPGDVLTVSEVLLPGGLPRGADDVPVHARRRPSPACSTSRPTTAATRAIARATPSPRSTRRSPTSSTSRRPAARSRRCSIRARRPSRSPPDGTPVELAGSDRGPALAEGSPLLEVLAGQVPSDGHERRFLWPDGESGWYRVRIVPCLDEAGGRSLALVTVRPCEHVLGLTRREIEVLTHLAGGASNPAIARLLHVSPRTVATHVEHILEKLDVSTRAAAAGRAVREALVLPGLGGNPGKSGCEIRV